MTSTSLNGLSLDWIVKASNDWILDPSGDWKTDPEAEWLFNPVLNFIFNAKNDCLYIRRSETGEDIWDIMKPDTEFEEYDSINKTNDKLLGDEIIQKYDDEDTLNNNRDKLNRAEDEDENKNENDNFENESNNINEDLLSDLDQEEIQIDLEKDLISGSISIKSNIEAKEECEDRYLIFTFPMNILSNNEALCYYFAVFDGHGGSGCSEYVQRHLHNNIMSSFNQTLSQIERSRHQAKKKRRRRNIKEHSVEIESLLLSCKRGYQMTENNYLGISAKKGLTDGSTACSIMIYGPDIDGSLKLISAHIGDTRAILCRQGIAIALTDDHKPNREDETKRIEDEGGKIIKLEGIYRVVAPPTKKYPDARGLSVSRSFGDIPLKEKKFVSAIPDIELYTLDIDNDYFLVIASDGIFDVLTNQEVVDIILSESHKKPEDIAKLIAEEAEKRGSLDDKTCLIVFFGWNKKQWLSYSKNINLQPSINFEKEILEKPFLIDSTQNTLEKDKEDFIEDDIFAHAD